MRRIVYIERNSLAGRRDEGCDIRRSKQDACPPTEDGAKTTVKSVLAVNVLPSIQHAPCELVGLSSVWLDPRKYPSTTLVNLEGSRLLKIMSRLEYEIVHFLKAP